MDPKDYFHTSSPDPVQLVRRIQELEDLNESLKKEIQRLKDKLNFKNKMNEVHINTLIDQINNT